ncbi:hypothetical protein [Roseomonas sp. BN140053]|uniref:hypothetical protein n=1 Tax=Roseomonas sp. BN140053 TaxID=3391898 RepID=UPI0039EA8C44
MSPSPEPALSALLHHLPGEAGRWVAEAVGREPRCHYHGPSHLARLWQLFEAGGWAVDRDAMALAIAFHDFVLNPATARGADEAASAAWFRAAAGPLRLPPDQVDAVAAAILATADHFSPAGSALAAALCDLDLSGLAGSWDGYRADTLALRREYPGVTDAGFAAGRAAFLRGVLQHPRLFQHPATPPDWEARARQNLTRSLEPGVLDRWLAEGTAPPARPGA